VLAFSLFAEAPNRAHCLQFLRFVDRQKSRPAMTVRSCAIPVEDGAGQPDLFFATTALREENVSFIRSQSRGTLAKRVMQLVRCP